MDFRISPSTVQKQTVEKLREAIIAGIFRPGDRLVEAELCAMLGVSRPSVREALRSLEAERLIANVPKRGTQIPVIGWDEAQQIYHVRSLLESEAAALCAERVRPEDLNAMNRALEEFADAVEAADRQAMLKTTARFYDILLERCGNAIIAEVLRGLIARISFLRDRSMSRRGRARHSLKEMHAILAAVQSGDARLARRVAERHVAKAMAAARESFAEDEANAAAARSQAGDDDTPAPARRGRRR